MVQLIAQGEKKWEGQQLQPESSRLDQGEDTTGGEIRCAKSWFASYGREHIKDPATAAMYQNKLNELQQQGFGVSGQGIHVKHARASPMSVARALPVAILRV